jgi:glycerol uptake facilitator-like aquaporin
VSYLKLCSIRFRICCDIRKNLIRNSLSASKKQIATAPPFLLGSNIVTPELPIASAFLIELMGTFLLVWTVCMTAVSKNSIAANIAPIAIGWSVLLAHLILIPYTGCGINPARSFGPHIVVIMAGEKIGYAGWWVYYTAPFVG